MTPIIQVEHFSKLRKKPPLRRKIPPLDLYGAFAKLLLVIKRAKKQTGNSSNCKTKRKPVIKE